MKVWLRNDFAPWMRHKVRVVILKQWKKPKTIQRNLSRLNAKLHCNMSDEDIGKIAPPAALARQNSLTLTEF